MAKGSNTSGDDSKPSKPKKKLPKVRDLKNTNLQKDVTGGGGGGGGHTYTPETGCGHSTNYCTEVCQG
jgi:hypothetical protein